MGHVANLDLYDYAKKPEGRRWKVLTIDIDALLGFFTPADARRWFQCEDGLPEGAKVIGVHVDPILRRIFIAVEHDSYPEVEPPQVPEDIWCSFRSYTEPELRLADPA